MKKLIKKWLGIQEYKDPDLSEDIKNAVKDAFYEAFEPEIPREYKLRYFIDDYKSIHGTLDKRIKKLYIKEINIATQKAIDNIANKESFIDEIVKRIKDKQL